MASSPIRRCAVVLLTALVAACSVLLDRETEQCSSDQDCKARGGQFSASVCDQASKTCVTNLGHESDGGQDAAPVSCQANADCLSSGTRVCVDNQCRPLSSTDCTRVFGQARLANEDVILLGLLTPLTGSQAGFGRSLSDAVEAAHQSYDKGSSELSPLAPVAIVRCDEDRDVGATIDHLLGLEVDGVIGPMLDDHLISITPQIRNSQLLTITALANDPRLLSGEAATAAADGLLWSIRPNRMSEIDYLTVAFEQVRSLADAKSPGEFTTLNVAIVSPENAGTQLFTAELKNKLPNANLITSSATPAEVASAVTSLTPPPNIVFAVSENEPWHEYIELIESQWPGSEPRPYYFLASPMPLVLIDAVKNKLPPRIVGTRPARGSGSQQVYNTFQGSFAAVAGGEAPPRAEYAFDGALAAIYAVHGARRLKSAKPGDDYRTMLEATFRPPGPATAVTNYAAIAPLVSLATQGILDAYGASGSVDFESTGAPRQDATLFCYSESQQNWCDTGLVFPALGGAPTGSIDASCSCSFQ